MSDQIEASPNGDKLSGVSPDSQKIDDGASNISDSPKKEVDDEGELQDVEQGTNENAEKIKEQGEEMEEKSPVPASKRSALERLKNMNFSKKDPFGNVAREHRTMKFTSGKVDKSPLKKADLDHDHDAPKYSSTTTKHTPDTQTMHDSNRHSMRYHPYSNEKNMNSSRTSVQPGTLKQRIDNVLSIPEENAMGLMYDDLYGLIMQLIELEREQQHLLNGRCQQIIELDNILNKERDEIEKLKKDIPEQFHPPANIYEPMFSNDKLAQNVGYQNPMYQNMPYHIEFNRANNFNFQSNSSGNFPPQMQMGPNPHAPQASQINMVFENRPINPSSLENVSNFNAQQNTSFRNFQQDLPINEDQELSKPPSNPQAIPPISTTVPPPNFTSVPPPNFSTAPPSVPNPSMLTTQTADKNSATMSPFQMPNLNAPPPNLAQNSIQTSVNTSIPPPVIPTNLNVPPPSFIGHNIVPNMSVPPPNQLIPPPTQTIPPPNPVPLMSIPHFSSSPNNSFNSNWKRDTPRKEESWHVRKTEETKMEFKVQEQKIEGLSEEKSVEIISIKNEAPVPIE